MKKTRFYLILTLILLQCIILNSNKVNANTQSTSISTQLDQNIKGTLSKDIPIIWYKFYVPCSGKVTIELNTQCEATSFLLTKIDDQQGNYIDCVEQWEDRGFLESKDTLIANLKKGTYYIKVNSSAEVIGWHSEYGTFEFAIRFSPTSFVQNNIKYKVTGKNTVTVTGLKDKYVQSVKIPETANIKELNKSYKVTAISNKAFKGNSFIRKVTFSKSVKKIGKQAFYKCKKLKKVTFESKVKLGKNTFKGTSKKIKFKYPKKYKFYYKYILK